MNSGFFVLLIGGLLIAIVLILTLPLPRSRRRASTPVDSPRTRVIYRDDDRYWYAGFFYNNPDDPDPFVPKRYGLGWTVNFGHPGGKFILIGLLLLLLLPLVVAILGDLYPGLLHSSGCHLSGCHG